jgi:hypothetical protein
MRDGFRERLDGPFHEIKWDDSFTALLDGAPDVELCAQLGLLVKRECGWMPEFDETRPDLCFRFAYCAAVDFENEGFNRIFEGDRYASDPHLLNALRAFEIIGVPKVVGAFDIAMSVFPNGIPPSNAAERFNIWSSADESITDRAHDEWHAARPLTRTFAEYIRRNRERLLKRYRFVRKWPDEPYPRSAIDALFKSEGTHSHAARDMQYDNELFSTFTDVERDAWNRELNVARKLHGEDFGPEHPRYAEWEKWYLQNRMKLVWQASDES